MNTTEHTDQTYIHVVLWDDEDDVAEGLWVKPTGPNTGTLAGKPDPMGATEYRFTLASHWHDGLVVL